MAFPLEKVLVKHLTSQKYKNKTNPYISSLQRVHAWAQSLATALRTDF